MSLPRKDQLLVLFIGRLADFLQIASLQAYVFYQLKHMDSDLSDSRISERAGLLQGCFTGAQVCTAILWGNIADANWCGRKWALIIGLGGTALSCVGYGFSTTFFWAAFWRIFGGAINGTVGIIRTMISEITVEKRFQSRAFLLLPLSFNAASMLGPIMGGLLADPTSTLPDYFSEGAIFGFQWIRDYPFALPSLLNAVFLAFSTLITFLFLEETSKDRRHKYDPGLHLGYRMRRSFAGLLGPKFMGGYAQVPLWEQGDSVGEKDAAAAAAAANSSKTLGRLPFSRIWTRNVIFTLINSAFYDFQLGAFTNIWSLFLSTPRYGTPSTTGDGKAYSRSLPLLFTGGLGMPASTVGVASSLLGLLGMILQFTLYPPVQARLGTMRSFRWFLILFPVAYFIGPYLSILPSSTQPPEAASGSWIWAGIILILLLQVMARTFTLPATIILLNNCSPHPSVLGTIHGLGQSVSAAFRTVGPVVGGWWYGYGLDIGMVAWGWWGVAAVATLGCGTALLMHEGSGHEIFLEGEREEMDDE
ncbi:major facilitator superfamily domain-containing protein [Dactylonectria estremocensis]|uniref:Major facilitator superfamily domain-containing protein n=1 Tax=Dactylonectria estremocensis TaxID=1079267 RepID=A0A9P9ISC1_9HYPO|nr:major facilitator superfamily domain-containing protein [Dactylonectria estremocensis]